mgnify:CR=1 FL=1
MLFDIYIPRDLVDASEFLYRNAPDAVPIAGGTDLIPMIRDGKLRPKYLVDLSGLKGRLSYVSIDSGVVRVGALTTINALGASALTGMEAFLGFRDLYKTFGNAAVRSLATVGGNVGTAVSAADLIVMFNALDAKVGLSGVNGSRYVGIRELVAGKRLLAKEPGELITEVVFNVPPKNSSTAFIKLDYREGTIIGLISVAALVTVRDGVIEDVKLAFDRVDRRVPGRAYLTEKGLKGVPLRDEAVGEVINEHLPREMRRKSDYRASGAYRLHVSKVLARRAVLTAGRRAVGGG